MTHGDDNGLILPPAVAPIQVAIIPVAQHKEGVLEAASALRDRLSAKFRVKLDDSDNSAGWKYSQYEMKGVPLRLELGPRDIESGTCVLVSRVSREKTALNYDEFLDIAANKSGFIKAMWCGDSECEDKIKNDTGGVKSRCIPFDEEHLSDVCVCCGKPAKHMVVWGRQD